MNIEVIFAILAVALVLLLLSAFPTTRYILWESVLHPFRGGGSAHDPGIAPDPVGRESRDVRVSRPKQQSKEEMEDHARLVTR